MKTGKTLTELAKTVEEMQKTAIDYGVPASELKATANGSLKLGFKDKEFSLNTHSSGQVAEFATIPRQYFRRIQTENPQLTADSINHGLKQKANDSKVSPRMLRTVERNGLPIIRGFVSNRYKPFDCYDMLKNIFPSIQAAGLRPVSTELTEQRMYLKLVSDKLKGEVKKGDIVQYGLVISNSDVGSGAARIEPLIYRCWCDNGAIMSTALKKHHLGRANSTDADLYEILRDETRQLDQDAFWAKMIDVVNHYLKPEVFAREVEKIQETTERSIESADSKKVIEVSMKKLGITGDSLTNLLTKNLLTGNQGAGYTQWGLANSFTAAAKSDKLTYEQATELERAGGQIITLSKTDWTQISQASA